MIQRRRVIYAIAAVIVAGFGWFVWPTPYRNVALPGMLQSRSDRACCFAARTNRFTSEIEVLTAAGWQSLSLAKDSATARAAAALMLPVSDEYRELARRGWYDTTAKPETLLTDSAAIRRRLTKTP
jgi:hypothetical protein